MLHFNAETQHSTSCSNNKLQVASIVVVDLLSVKPADLLSAWLLSDKIWPKLELIQAPMVVLIT